MSELNDTLTGLPKYPESLWRATTQFTEFPRLTQDTEADVTVVGAGIAGITTAFLLAKEGLNVVVLEAGKVLDGTTGHTTAKITSQHGLFYGKLLDEVGEENARLYYEANEGALRFIRELIHDNQIDCQFKKEDAYVYGQADHSLKALQKEFEAYEKLKIPGLWMDRIPLPFPSSGSIRLGDQAQFHPLLFLQWMVTELVRMGVRIYEQTTAADLEEDHQAKVIVQRGQHSVTSNHVVIASHFPFHDSGLYFSRLHAERSYAIAVKPETTYAGGMYITSDEPKRSIRSVSYQGEDLLIIGGENHKTGQGGCTINHYEHLEQFAGKTFGVHSALFRWSAQDLISLDQVPYIGPITADRDRVFLATGFGKWGMTTGVLAGQLISSQILQRDNPFGDIFVPSRFRTGSTLTNLVVQNANVAKKLISGKLGIVHEKTEHLQKDEGAVVRHNGRRAGAYRDPEGHIHLVDTTCTHMGCEVEWNAGERSWDCPCHGARYNYDGKVIEGPAKENLKIFDAHEA